MPMSELRDGFKFRSGSLALDLPATLAARLRPEPKDRLATPRDLARFRFSMQSARIGGERFPQLGDAEDVRVEELAGADRVGAGLADEIRRRLVGLADPEREDVAPADAFVVELADLRSGELAHGGASGEWAHFGYSWAEAQFSENQV